MLFKHYERYFSRMFSLCDEETVDLHGDLDVKEGCLVSRKDNRAIPIVNHVPRFIHGFNYADSFGYQWNMFRTTQLDSRTGLPLTAERFWANTRWSPEDMRGKTVLEAGSGAGRFTEVMLGVEGLDLVSFDYSTAVDANYKSNAQSRLLLFQGDIFDLPLEEDSFDYVFCYGVLQHTPDPKKAFLSLLRYLKPGGRFSVDIYRKMFTPAPWYFPKYFWRPISTRMDKELLLKILRFYIPFWLPVDTLIKSIPVVGRYLSGCIPIPCWNYSWLGLSREQVVEWAIMDTFDALSPAYDIPKTKGEIERWCAIPGLTEVEVFHGGNGVVANGRKILDA